MTGRFAKTEELHGADVNLFGVFDGHGGNRCSNYLKEVLFNELLANKDFGKDINNKIIQTYCSVDSNFLKASERNSTIDKSGSCAVVSLIISMQSTNRRRGAVLYKPGRLSGHPEPSLWRGGCAVH